MNLGQRFKITSLLAAGLLGAATVVAVILYVTLQLTVQTRTAAELLPADATILFVERPSAQMIAALSPWFPSLQLPSPGPDAFAVVRNSAGPAIISLYREPNLPALQTPSVSYPPFVAAAADASVLRLLKSGPSALAEQPAFRQLASGHEEAAWAYIRTDAVPPATSSAETLLRAAIIGSGAAFALTSENEFVAMSGLREGRASRIDVPLHITRLLPEADVIVQTEMLPDGWESLLASLPTEQSQVWDSIARQYAAELLGPSIRLDYDLLPLTGGPVVLELARTASGTLQFALQGRTVQVSDFEERIAALHSAATGGDVPVAVREALFDDQFPLRQVYVPDSSDLTTMTRQGDWEITKTTDIFGRPRLISAVGKGRFVVSNVADLSAVLDQGRSNLQFNEPAFAGGTRLANGLVDVQALAAYAGNSTATGALNTIWPRPFRWTLSQNGGVRTIVTGPAFHSPVQTGSGTRL